MHCLCEINQHSCKLHESFTLKNLPKSSYVFSENNWNAEVERRDPGDVAQKFTLTNLPKIPNVEDMGMESWDSENVGTYNPLESICEKNVIRPPLIGASKTMKRQFRLQERQRLQIIQEKKDV